MYPCNDDKRIAPQSRVWSEGMFEDVAQKNMYILIVMNIDHLILHMLDKSIHDFSKSMDTTR